MQSRSGRGFPGGIQENPSRSPWLPRYSGHAKSVVIDTLDKDVLMLPTSNRVEQPATISVPPADATRVSGTRPVPQNTVRPLPKGGAANRANGEACPRLRPSHRRRTGSTAAGGINNTERQARTRERGVVEGDASLRHHVADRRRIRVLDLAPDHVVPLAVVLSKT